MCDRALGPRVEWHHPVPKSRGGRDTVPVHPICHATLHRHFSNTELAVFGDDVAALRRQEKVARFLRWIDRKPPEFHAPTRKRRNSI
nr:HNH endonuclease [Oricola indica]